MEPAGVREFALSAMTIDHEMNRLPAGAGERGPGRVPRKRQRLVCSA